MVLYITLWWRGHWPWLVSACWNWQRCRQSNKALPSWRKRALFAASQVASLYHSTLSGRSMEHGSYAVTTDIWIWLLNWITTLCQTFKTSLLNYMVERSSVSLTWGKVIIKCQCRRKTSTRLLWSCLAGSKSFATCFFGLHVLVLPVVHGWSSDGLDFAFVNLDNILFGIASQEEHLLHLCLVLKRLCHYGLLLNMEKCQLAASPFISWATTSKLRGWACAQACGGHPAVSSASRQQACQNLLRLVNFYQIHSVGGPDPSSSHVAVKRQDAARVYWT